MKMNFDVNTSVKCDFDDFDVVVNGQAPARIPVRGIAIEKDGIFYKLPLAHLEKAPLSQNLKSEQRAFNHGGIPTGFAKVAARTVEVDCYIEANTEAEYFAITEELKRHVFQEDFRLWVADNRHFRIRALTKYEESVYSGFYQRRCNVTLAFLALDPFLYSGRLIKESLTASDGAELAVMNYGNIDAPLIINITPVSTLPSLKLTHASGERTAYNDPAFTVGQTLTINSETGTVMVNGRNSINNFGGVFPQLRPKRNIFSFSGGNCTIEFTYHERFI